MEHALVNLGGYFQDEGDLYQASYFFDQAKDYFIKPFGIQTYILIFMTSFLLND